MKKVSALLVAATLVATCWASVQEPEVPANFGLSYQWSLSAREYLLAERPIYSAVFEVPRLDFCAVAGYGLTPLVPTLGFGLTYSAELSKEGRVYARFGAYALFPQGQRADLSFGISVGVRF